ncbi:MAG: hypothetical protein PHE24_07025 [Patescibacteria group bacterium]|nr:hypothetical protein [Patescibacteria group bacterium]
MTAQIGILNKEAIALASDSAVTMTQAGGQKIFSSANKIFALSKAAPVAFMVSGKAMFMDVPWETIVKLYRDERGEEKFERLEDYAKDFLDFLGARNIFIPAEIQEECISDTLISLFSLIRGECEKSVSELIAEGKVLSAQELRDKVFTKVIEEQFNIWEAETFPQENLQTKTEDFTKKYEKRIREKINAIFEKAPLEEQLANKLVKIGVYIFFKFSKIITHSSESEIVIAGFGEKDIFPSLRSYYVEFVVNNHLKFRKHNTTDISFNLPSSIVPFAQREMVDMFMRGIDPSIQKVFFESGFKILSQLPDLIINEVKCLSPEEKEKTKANFKNVVKDIFGAYAEDIKRYQKQKITNRITTVVSMLPKDELAAMAETLVNITSFKRRVSTQAETVGGPIDVVVISKKDGLIWIKRKHYFDKDLNFQYFSNWRCIQNDPTQ